MAQSSMTGSTGVRDGSRCAIQLSVCMCVRERVCVCMRVHVCIGVCVSVQYVYLDVLVLIH